MAGKYDLIYGAIQEQARNKGDVPTALSRNVSVRFRRRVDLLSQPRSYAADRVAFLIGALRNPQGCGPRARPARAPYRTTRKYR